MRFHTYICAVGLAAACATALAGGNAGSFTRDGKQSVYTAIHVEPAHRQINFDTQAIVFSDDAAASDAVSKIAYGTIDGVLTGDIVYSQLSDHGAHPIELKIQPAASDAGDDAKDQRSVELLIWNGKDKPPLDVSATANAPDSPVQLQLTRDDGQRLEGSVKYADKEKGLTADLPFALDVGPMVMFGKKLEVQAPPPPPPPPKKH